MRQLRKLLVRFAPLVALLWLGSAYAGGGTEALDPGSGTASAPRVMTLEEEMVDLRADAVRYARTAAQEQAADGAVQGLALNVSAEQQAADLAALTLVNLATAQVSAASEAEEMIELRHEYKCLQEAASDTGADAVYVSDAPGNRACFAGPQRIF